MTIQIPLVVLRNQLSSLITNITLDEHEQYLVDTPQRINDKYFARAKLHIRSHRSHSAVILAGERVLMDEDLEPSRLVESTMDWDMEEDAYPILREWRRRWWSHLPVPQAWVDEVVLTNEDMTTWVARQKTGDGLPPYIPLRALDLRHSATPIGWSLDSTADQWQRLRNSHREDSIILPPDPTLLEEIAVHVFVAWSRPTGQAPGPTPTTPPLSAQALAEAAAARGLPGCAALFNAVAAHPERPETAAQLQVAQALLESWRPDPSTIP